MFIRGQNGSGEAGGDCVAWHEKKLDNGYYNSDGVASVKG